MQLVTWQKPYFAASTGTTGIIEFLCDMASDSDVSGVDVTATAVHDCPFEDSPSMQVDDFTGVDIPFDSQESRDVQGYLESLNRSPTTPISSSSDAEVVDVDTKVPSRSPHMGPQKKKKQPRRQPPTATIRHQVPSGDKPDKPRLLQWTGYIWAVHCKLCLHRMM